MRKNVYGHLYDPVRSSLRRWDVHYIHEWSFKEVSLVIDIVAKDQDFFVLNLSINWIHHLPRLWKHIIVSGHLRYRVLYILTILISE